MKFRKFIKISGVIILVLTVLVVWRFLVNSLLQHNWTPGIKYSSGKDTVASFGDGTYQISHDALGNKGLMSLNPPQSTIIENVEKFIKIKKKGQVYLIGDGYFVILYYKAKYFRKDANLNNFTLEEQKIFRALK